MVSAEAGQEPLRDGSMMECLIKLHPSGRSNRAADAKLLLCHQSWLGKGAQSLSTISPCASLSVTTKLLSYELVRRAEGWTLLGD